MHQKSAFDDMESRLGGGWPRRRGAQKVNPRTEPDARAAEKRRTQARRRQRQARDTQDT